MDALEKRIRKLLEDADPKTIEIVTEIVIKKIKNKEHLASGDSGREGLD